MSVSGKKEFDVKQILRLRWRWFSHPSQGSPNSGSCLQQEGYEHRGTPVQGRLKNHSRDRNGLKKSNSPVHHNILAPVPGPAPAHQRALQNWHQQNLIEHLRANEDIPKAVPEKNLFKEACEKHSQNLEMMVDGNTEDSTVRLTTQHSDEMNVSSPEEHFYAVNHAQETLHRMENYLKEKQLCDVLLIAGHLRIPAHRLVLSAVSDYFAAMFTHDVLEAKQEEVKMEGVDPNALNSLLKEDTIENLLAAACLLQLTQVIEVCSNFLIKQLHPSNCLGIRSFGDAQGCTELLNVAHKYTMEHFLEVIKNQEFLLLPANEISKLLCSDDINVPDEETIFNALMKWVGHDVQARQRDLAMLLSYIRLPLLPPQLLADLENSSMFTGDLECQKLLMEAMKYHLLPDRRPMMQSPRTKPRKSTVGALYAVGGMDAMKGTITIEKYDLRTNSWLHIATMSGRRLQFGVAVIDNKLYVVGGRDGLKTLNTVECFNPVGKVWSVMPPMSTHRHGLGVATLEGPMYAVGGHDGWSYLNTVERWDPEGRQWNYVASMSTPRSTVGVVALNNNSCLKSMEYFDPHTNKWSLCAPMSKRRGGVGVATYNGYLYVVGGHDAPASNHCSRLSDCVERYDPKTDSWSTVAPLNVPRDAVAVCPLGDKLFVVGGYDGHNYLNTVESYDAQKDEWKEVLKLLYFKIYVCSSILFLSRVQSDYFSEMCQMCFTYIISIELVC
ncbi:Kelch-like protein 4 [Galemys pyrenaicus]|uniref:Kelch-like protein 4 n=1 Tax=Galemys pyrenaicus TaxID=202257 RepID=A0A8J6DJF5_GALPY|nr:Kelch-like protein 4 [Galemys pyrenaicus]